MANIHDITRDSYEKTNRRSALLGSAVAITMYVAGGAARGSPDATGDRLGPHHHQRHVEHPCVHRLDDHSPRDARAVAGALEGPDFWANALKPGGVEAFEIAIPAATLTSPKEGLDKNMHKALQVKEHPDIVFRLLRLEPRAGAAGALRGIGVLQIAGVEREVALDITTERKDSTLSVQGQVQLLMTDFGIKPPMAMLGMLKTDPKVTVTFETVLTIPLT